MDELSDVLADGDPFSVEPGAAGELVVSYDDVVAHEHADLVAASAVALEAVVGVREVVHEDREVLVVRIGAPATAADVEAALRTFWRQAASRPTASQETLKALAFSVAPRLRQEGFRKQALRWNREVTPGFVQVIELGRAEEGDGYVGTVDLGLFDDETAARREGAGRRRFVSEPHCQVRRPAGTFPLGDDPAPLVHLLDAQVLPLLERVRSRADVLSEPWPGALFNPIDRAIMLAVEGDHTAARTILQDCFERLRFARAHLHGVVARCDLEPLETGSTPDRSRAEDAVVPAWIAEVAASLDHLRRAVAGAGLDPRLLDETPGSLDPLHRVWRDLVARAQADDATPSAFMALPTGTWSRYRSAPPADPRPTRAAQRLTEGLACYLAAVVRRRVPAVRWELVDTSSGFEPALAGLPLGPIHVVKRSIDLLDAALRPMTAEQERLFRRYNPLRADVERWLEAAPPAATTSRGLFGRFRRG